MVLLRYLPRLVHTATAAWEGDGDDSRWDVRFSMRGMQKQAKDCALHLPHCLAPLPAAFDTYP